MASLENSFPSPSQSTNFDILGDPISLILNDAETPANNGLDSGHESHRTALRQQLLDGLSDLTLKAVLYPFDVTDVFTASLAFLNQEKPASQLQEPVNHLPVSHSALSFAA